MIERKSNKGADVSADDDFLKLRKGEVAVAPPKKFDASLYFIGRIRTPWQSRAQCPKNPRESDAICTIELDPRWTPALKGLEIVTHVLLLYWMDRTRRDLVVQVPRHYGEQRGTFALRSPARPNPIAVSVARVVRIEGNALYVVGIDCFSTSSRILLRPIQFPKRSWDGTRGAESELNLAPRNDKGGVGFGMGRIRHGMTAITLA